MTARVKAMREGYVVESCVPARLARLPWTRQHWLIVCALGAIWILDGLEVTLTGAVGAMLTHCATLNLTAAEVGASATCYLAGAVIGAIAFGYATDRLGWRSAFGIGAALGLVVMFLRRWIPESLRWLMIHGRE